MNNQKQQIEKISNKGFKKETQTINFSKALIEITTALDTCIKAMTLKTKYTTPTFKPQKEKLLDNVKEKINN